jgi:hypothetical protein
MHAIDDSGFRFGQAGCDTSKSCAMRSPAAPELTLSVRTSRPLLDPQQQGVVAGIAHDLEQTIKSRTSSRPSHAQKIAKAEGGENRRYKQTQAGQSRLPALLPRLPNGRTGPYQHLSPIMVGSHSPHKGAGTHASAGRLVLRFPVGGLLRLLDGRRRVNRRLAGILNTMAPRRARSLR